MKVRRPGRIENLTCVTFTLTLLAGTSFFTPAEGLQVPSSSADPAAGVWLDPNGDPLPFKTDTEVQQFLETAEVVFSEKITWGLTRPRKVLLEKDGLRAHAIFRDVDIFEREFRGERGGVRINFRDSCLFECAAYELSQLLGLDNVPPVVRRTIEGQEGTLQIWVENAITEEIRLKNHVAPPNPWRWNMQQQVLKVFDNLIFNDDRNQGNMLISADWKLWWIDHTRAFRSLRALPDRKTIEFCERNLWKRLQTLDPDEVKERLKPYLRSTEISTLLKRRQALVEHIQGLIDERGERQVLFVFY